MKSMFEFRSRMGQLEKKVQKKTFGILESLEETEEKEGLETLRDLVKSES